MKNLFDAFFWLEPVVVNNQYESVKVSWKFENPGYIFSQLEDKLINYCYPDLTNLQPQKLIDFPGGDYNIFTISDSNDALVFHAISCRSLFPDHELGEGIRLCSHHTLCLVSFTPLNHLFSSNILDYLYSLQLLNNFNREEIESYRSRENLGLQFLNDLYQMKSTHDVLNEESITPHTPTAAPTPSSNTVLAVSASGGASSSSSSSNSFSSSSFHFNEQNTSDIDTMPANIDLSLARSALKKINYSFDSSSSYSKFIVTKPPQVFNFFTPTDYNLEYSSLLLKYQEKASSFFLNYQRKLLNKLTEESPSISSSSSSKANLFDLKNHSQILTGINTWVLTSPYGYVCPISSSPSSSFINSYDGDYTSNNLYLNNSNTILRNNSLTINYLKYFSIKNFFIIFSHILLEKRLIFVTNSNKKLLNNFYYNLLNLIHPLKFNFLYNNLISHNQFSSLTTCSFCLNKNSANPHSSNFSPSNHLFTSTSEGNSPVDFSSPLSDSFSSYDSPKQEERKKKNKPKNPFSHYLSSPNAELSCTCQPFFLGYCSNMDFSQFSNHLKHHSHSTKKNKLNNVLFVDLDSFILYPHKLSSPLIDILGDSNSVMNQAAEGLGRVKTGITSLISATIEVTSSSTTSATPPPIEPNITKKFGQHNNSNENSPKDFMASLALDFNNLLLFKSVNPSNLQNYTADMLIKGVNALTYFNPMASSSSSNHQSQHDNVPSPTSKLFDLNNKTELTSDHQFKCLVAKFYLFIFINIYHFIKFPSSDSSTLPKKKDDQDDDDDNEVNEDDFVFIMNGLIFNKTKYLKSRALLGATSQLLNFLSQFVHSTMFIKQCQRLLVLEKKFNFTNSLYKSRHHSDTTTQSNNDNDNRQKKFIPISKLKFLNNIDNLFLASFIELSIRFPSPIKSLNVNHIQECINSLYNFDLDAYNSPPSSLAPASLSKTFSSPYINLTPSTIKPNQSSSLISVNSSNSIHHLTFFYTRDNLSTDAGLAANVALGSAFSSSSYNIFKLLDIFDTFDCQLSLFNTSKSSSAFSSSINNPSTSNISPSSPFSTSISSSTSSNSSLIRLQSARTLLNSILFDTYHSLTLNSIIFTLEFRLKNALYKKLLNNSLNLSGIKSLLLINFLLISSSSYNLITQIKQNLLPLILKIFYACQKNLLKIRKKEKQNQAQHQAANSSSKTVQHQADKTMSKRNSLQSQKNSIDSKNKSNKSKSSAFSFADKFLNNITSIFQLNPSEIERNYLNYYIISSNILNLLIFPVKKLKIKNFGYNFVNYNKIFISSFLFYNKINLLRLNRIIYYEKVYKLVNDDEKKLNNDIDKKKLTVKKVKNFIPNFKQLHEFFKPIQCEKSLKLMHFSSCTTSSSSDSSTQSTVNSVDSTNYSDDFVNISTLDQSPVHTSQLLVPLTPPSHVIIPSHVCGDGDEEGEGDEYVLISNNKKNIQSESESDDIDTEADETESSDDDEIFISNNNFKIDDLPLINNAPLGDVNCPLGKQFRLKNLDTEEVMDIRHIYLNYSKYLPKPTIRIKLINKFSLILNRNRNNSDENLNNEKEKEYKLLYKKQLKKLKRKNAKLLTKNSKQSNNIIDNLTNFLFNDS